MKSKFGLAAGIACLTACTANSPPQATPSVSIMTFNVENLFDTKDDDGKDDKTFLPLSAKQNQAHIDECMQIEVDRWRRQCLEWDWNDAALEVKLQRLAAAILQVDGGRGPDILALQEIENRDILERLRKDYLQAADYGPSILIEGQDLRGIDVAFLTRLPLAEEPVLHPLTFDESVPERRALDARGVLEASFELPDGTLLTGYSVHFPAPFHPTHMRERAYEHLNALKATLPDDQPVFAAGDFNTTSVEDDEQDMLGRFVRPSWQLAHELGCEGCMGTSYYEPRQDWSFLDMVILDEGGGWALDASSVSIPNAAPEQSRVIDSGLAPRRFEMSTASGISDHYPVLIRIEKATDRN